MSGVDISVIDHVMAKYIKGHMYASQLDKIVDIYFVMFIIFLIDGGYGYGDAMYFFKTLEEF